MSRSNCDRVLIEIRFSLSIFAQNNMSGGVQAGEQPARGDCLGNVTGAG